MTELKALKNLGPGTIAELESIDIETLEELQKLGWEGVFIRLVDSYPDRLNLNTAAAIIGAVENVDSREISAEKRARAQKLIRELKV